METAFRVLAEHAPELIAQQRSDGVIEYVSRACRGLLGYEPHELVGISALSLLHPDEAEPVVEQHRGVRDRGLTATYTARLRRRDGSYVALDFTLYPLRRVGEPPPYGYVSVVRDASDRLHQERLQHANALRIRALLNAVPGMIYQAVSQREPDDPRITFTFVNDWPKNALGLELELPTLAERLVAITAPEDAQLAHDNLRDALRELKPWSWHGRFLPDSGVVVHVVGHSVPEVQRDGSVLWSGVIIDDTPRMRMQEALFQSEEQCRAVVAHMDMAHMRFALDGALQSVNPASVRLLGYDDEAELLDKSAALHLWPSPARYSDVLQRVLADGLAAIELPLRRRDGSLRTVQGALRLLRDAHGTPVAVDGVLRDVTEELRAREELVQAREMAEAGSKAKTAFLANMSHEIRTPMNAIIGLSHLALQADPPPKQHEYLTQIHAAGVALLGILNDILDVSKIEAGKLALEAEPFELEGVLSALARVVSMRAAEKELELVFAVDPRVPDELVGDRMRLGQVLTNLVSNAIKFTDAGEVQLTIDLVDAQPRQAGGALQLRFGVRDSGIGLTPEQQERLFVPFSQVDESTTRRHGGTGLGLAISQELVHIMGGHIEVHSRPGQGSEFFFTVGFGRGSEQPRPKLPGEPRVLVVDDSQAVRDALTRTLLAFGCAVAAVPSGAAALVALQQADQLGAPYQVAVIDARMPGMDGLTLVSRITDSMPPTRQPALLMIAAESQDELFGTREVGAVRTVLRKPLGRISLYDALASACRRDKTSLRPPGVTKEREQPLAGLRLLVVEDNEINQRLARELLEAAGAHVVIAGEGREAINLATTVEPAFDVILMDVQMPGMDGHATTRVLRTEKRTRATPIIAMTAHAFDAERKKCLESGMNAHVAKPINPPELLRTVLAWAHKTLEVPKTPVPPATPNQAADPERFDPTALRSVFRDPARQLSFLRKFVDSARLTLSGLEPAWHARSSEAIGFAGHKLKSSAKACGAHALANVCAALELHAKDDNWAELEPLRYEAERLLDEVRIAVEDLERRAK